RGCRTTSPRRRPRTFAPCARGSAVRSLRPWRSPIWPNPLVQRRQRPLHSYDSAMPGFRSTDNRRTEPEHEILRGMPLGPFETNCYLYTPASAAGGCWIIDAGLGPEPLIEAVRQAGL